MWIYTHVNIYIYMCVCVYVCVCVLCIVNLWHLLYHPHMHAIPLYCYTQPFRIRIGGHRGGVRHLSLLFSYQGKCAFFFPCSYRYAHSLTLTLSLSSLLICLHFFPGFLCSFICLHLRLLILFSCLLEAYQQAQAAPAPVQASSASSAPSAPISSANRGGGKNRGRGGGKFKYHGQHNCKYE